MVQCGMHVGSHGYDHYWLGSLSKEKQAFEIKQATEFIKNMHVGGGGKSLLYNVLPLRRLQCRYAIFIETI
jgi:hypothetical protein